VKPERGADQIARQLGRRSLATSVGLGVSAVCVILAFRGANVEDVTAALAQADMLLVVSAFVAAMAATGASVFRWRILLQPYPTRVAKLFSAFMIAHLLNTVLPAKLGTVARAYLAGEMEKIGKAFVLGSIAVEKVLDNVIIVLLGVLLFPFVALPEWLWQSGVSTAILFLAMFTLTILAGRNREVLVRWTESLYSNLRVHPPVDLVRHLGLALDSFAALSQPDICWPLWGWSLLIWGSGILANQLVMMAMGIRAPWVAAVFLLVVLQIGTKLPSSPGSVGVFHYLAVLALSVFSVDKSLALSYGLVLHAVVVLLPSVFGAFFLWRESCTRADISLWGAEAQVGLVER